MGRTDCRGQDRLRAAASRFTAALLLHAPLLLFSGSAAGVDAVGSIELLIPCNDRSDRGKAMYYKPLLLPLLAQVLITFLVWMYMYARRLTEISRQSIDPQALQDRAEAHGILSESADASNNLKNLFEMPVLFYTAMLLALVLMVQDTLLVQLAWGFVALRAVHSVVHCTYNRVMHRFIAYALSSLFLLFIWVRLAAHILAQ
jgi:hypothetical protein